MYGEPTGFRILTELWGVREANASWGLLWIELPGIWSSFIGRFGFGQIPLPAPVYQTSWGLTFFAILGIGVKALWQWLEPSLGDQAEQNRGETPHLWLLGLVAVIAIVVVFAYVLVSPAGAMGRFLFPGLPAFAMLIFYGLTQWPKLLGWDWDRQLAIGLNILLLWVSVWALFLFIQPAYAQPENLASRDSIAQGTQNQPHAAYFEPFVHLIDASLDSYQITPGNPIDLSLAWSVTSKPFGDFYFFVHLVDQKTGELIAQRDTQPATGKFPMSLWTEGYQFEEQIQIQIPETAHPGAADLLIGFYAPIEGYRLSVSNGAGDPLGDSYMVGTVDLIPREGLYPNAQTWNFEGRARLRGYEYSSRNPSAGEPVSITFYWDLLDKSKLKHTDALVLMYWDDGTVSEARKPFSEIMQPANQGDTAIDSRIVLDNDLPLAGLHKVSLILIDQFTGERVNMVTARGNWIDDELKLPSIRTK